MGDKVFKYYQRTYPLVVKEADRMTVKKKSVSFDPQIYKAACDHQANLIKELGRPVSFSEAVNDLLRTALKGVEP